MISTETVQHTVVGSRIESIGAYQPDKKLTTAEIMSRLLLPGKFKFELLTGIKSRRICSENEDSLSLALSAAQVCFGHSHLEPADIDLIINCSITRYRQQYNQLYEPSLSFLLKESIGAIGARYFDISNACAGMLTGVNIANQMIKQGKIRNALIVSGEFISSLIDHAIRNIKTPASQEFASLTVGDAGAAVILEACTEKESAIGLGGFSAVTKYNDLCIAQPTRRQPGADMKTKATKIHHISISKSLPIFEKAMEEQGFGYADIDWVIPHQTSKSAILSGIKSFAAHFGAHPRNTIINLAENGNTASTSHFVTLYQYLVNKKFKADDRIVLLSFASGIVFGLLAFKPQDLILRYGNEN